MTQFPQDDDAPMTGHLAAQTSAHSALTRMDARLDAGNRPESDRDQATPTRSVMGRRAFLGLTGAVSVLGLAACAPSPLITPSSTSRPVATPTVEPWQAAIGERLVDLQAVVDEVAAAEVEHVGPWCAEMAPCVTAHSTIVLQADPLAGVQGDHRPLLTPSPAPVGDISSPEAACQALANAWWAVNEACTAAIDGVESLAMRLLITSLIVDARTYTASCERGPQELGPAPVPGDVIPAPLPATISASQNPDASSTPDANTAPTTPAEGDGPPLAQAWQALLSRHRALIFGLSTMLGKTPGDDAAYGDYRARLAEVMNSRDQVLAAMTRASITPDDAQPAYAMPGNTDDPAQFTQIRNDLEAGLMAGWVAVAAYDSPERELATDAAWRQAEMVRRRGMSLTYWPGWV